MQTPVALTQTPIALVVDMEKVKISLNVPEKYVSKVRLGQEAKIRVDAYPEEDFLGTIAKISPVLDVETRSVPLEITVNNTDHRLKSGMYAKVWLTIAHNTKMPVVLKEALMGRGDDQFVFVSKEGKAQMRKIKVGIRSGAYVGLTEGVEEGESVVIMGQQRLSDGVAIRGEEWS
jgi:membrane fusion protein (multidrug efflux system)